MSNYKQSEKLAKIVNSLYSDSNLVIMKEKKTKKFDLFNRRYLKQEIHISPKETGLKLSELNNFVENIVHNHVNQNEVKATISYFGNDRGPKQSPILLGTKVTIYGWIRLKSKDLIDNKKQYSTLELLLHPNKHNCLKERYTECLIK